MDFEWVVKYATEFLGTAILIVLGNGAVANVELKGTKGHQSGWLVIAVGYGMGVMIPVTISTLPLLWDLLSAVISLGHRLHHILQRRFWELSSDRL